MSGSFQKAPLVYVTANVRLVEIPELDEADERKLHHAMIRAGLTERRESVSHGFDLNQLHQAMKNPGQPGFKGAKEEVRWGFFGPDSDESLIVDRDNLEYRVTEYGKYENFIRRFSEILEGLKSIEILGYLDTNEITLTYCDAIIPVYGRELKEYFSNKASVLPLDFVSDHQQSDVFQTGQLQVTRVIAPNEKIAVHLEQLPFNSNGKPGKWLTGPVSEPDQRFSMKLQLRDEWSKDRPSGSYFGLLTTQASKIVKTKINALNVEEVFTSSHQVTKETFNEIINKSICDEDWLYTEAD